MPRFIFRDGQMVEVVRGPRQPSVFPNIRGDLPEYVSPVTGAPVDGRAARREDLKRAGCREVDPSEGPRDRGMYSESMAERYGAEVIERPAAPQHVADWYAGRGVERASVDLPPIMPLAGT